jgi:NTP pyrophosphatase (non-canonical NTP hydrolase)
MDSKTYQKNALVTEARDLGPVKERLQDTRNVRLLHAAMGLSTEAAEFTDMMKKAIFYGKPVDEVNLKEEVADLCWYCAIALDALGSSFEEVMATNIAKLKARYGDKFTEAAAIERDLDKEREILENNPAKMAAVIGLAKSLVNMSDDPIAKEALDRATATVYSHLWSNDSQEALDELVAKFGGVDELEETIKQNQANFGADPEVKAVIDELKKGDND